MTALENVMLQNSCDCECVHVKGSRCKNSKYVGIDKKKERKNESESEYEKRQIPMHESYV